MIQTVEAVIDVNGHVRLLGEVRINGPRRALVIVLEEPAAEPGKTARLAEVVPAGSETSLELWDTAWRAWAAGHKTTPSAADDDRDCIYAGRGE
jgi:hypothetical protein